MADENEDRGPRCGFEWRDGWGEHVCDMFLKFHHDRHHRCRCDATTMVVVIPESDKPDTAGKGRS